MGRLRTFLLTAALFACAIPAAAEANFVYWANDGQTSIGRAKLNGTGVNNNLIPGLNDPTAVAIDSKFIYWAEANSIGRANLDGTGANPNFIPAASGVTAPAGIAVTATHIYWANGTNTIGRAGIDGSGPVGNFINTAAGSHCGLAADSSFVYWIDSLAPTLIGRAPADGSGAAQPNFISGIDAGCGIAVDSSFIYWATDEPTRSIGRAAIGGTGATNGFIANATTALRPCGVAVNSQYVFWGNGPATAIGRANLGGGAPNPALAAGASAPCLPAAAPSNKITISSKKLKKKQGTAVLTVKVPGPGQVTLDNTPGSAAPASVKNVGLTRTGDGAFSVPIKPKGSTAKKLKKKGKAGVKAYLHFTPSGVTGVPNTQTVKLTLKKKLKKKKKKKK
jgi:hypothetical protein